MAPNVVGGGGWWSQGQKQLVKPKKTAVTAEPTASNRNEDSCPCRGKENIEFSSSPPMVT